MASIFFYEYLGKADFIYDNENQHNRNTGKKHIYKCIVSLKKMLLKKANK